ncbi:MAG: 30S ribosomal protein S8 [bacterium]
MDSIADLLVRLRNGLQVKKDFVDVPHSKMKEDILKILHEEGFIGKYEALAKMKKKYLRVTLKYIKGRQSVIAGMKRVSTPGRRIYVGAGEIPRVRSGFGVAIISTPKGVMQGEKAREGKVGGELLCSVW